MVAVEEEPRLAEHTVDLGATKIGARKTEIRIERYRSFATTPSSKKFNLDSGTSNYTRLHFSTLILLSILVKLLQKNMLVQF